MCKKITILIALISSLFLISCSNSDSNNEINISVASSLAEPIGEVIEEYQKDNNIEVNINSGGSGTLKNQILQGADVALFFSANEEYVNNLMEEGLVNSNNVSNPITNKLVLVKSDNEVKNVESLDELVNNGFKIAIGEVGTVPAGQYAKESLENIGVWDALEKDIIFAKDVSSVRTYVEIGEVDYGFIYQSDSINLENSEIVLEVDSNYHKEIIYSLSIIEEYSDSEEVKELFDFINSDASKKIFEEHGFKIKG